MRDGGDSAWDTLSAYGQVIRHRALVVVAVTVMLPLIAIFYSKLQDPVYEASANVLVSRENLAATLVSAPDTLVSTDPVRFMQTQAGLARTTDVARGTLNVTNPSGLTPEEFLGSSSVRAVTDSDLLVFSARAPVAADAVALADAYARSYTRYRNALDNAAVRRAIATLTNSIDSLKRAGQSDSTLFSTLLDKRQQLQTIAALRTGSSTLVQPAVEAAKISPQTAKTAQLATVFGLFLGLGLAFLLEARDRRLRSPDDISQRLQLPILGRIPPLTTSGERLAMMRPSGSVAEAYRILRLNIEFATADRNLRFVMVTSAMEGEGKSTTAANLAITLARAGRNVVLVDADFLRPSQARFFSVAGAPGLVQVAGREVDLARALTRVHLPVPVAQETGETPAALTLMSPLERRRWATSPKPPESTGLLRLLPTEEAPLDSTEAMVSNKLPQILAQLETDADLVIIDAPPLGTSVTLWLGSLVDGVLVVANAQLLRESMLDELVHSLDELPGEKLGLVLTGIDWYPRRGYGYRRSPTGPHDAGRVERASLVASSDRSS
jgi:succinoglycan biosynthesis transport protein ExoP